VAPLAATLVQLGISRSREFLADEAGARLSGDPEALACALERLHLSAQRVPGEAQPATASLFIVSPLAGAGSLLQLFSTHPAIEERVRRLRAMASGSAWAA
jgi:heat shock protein HtpX